MSTIAKTSSQFRGVAASILHMQHVLLWLSGRVLSHAVTKWEDGTPPNEKKPDIAGCQPRYHTLKQFPIAGKYACSFQQSRQTHLQEIVRGVDHTGWHVSQVVKVWEAVGCSTEVGRLAHSQDHDLARCNQRKIEWMSYRRQTHRDMQLDIVWARENQQLGS